MPFEDTRQPSGAKNYAEDEDVRARVRKEILPMLEEARRRRAKLNDDWARYHKAWDKQHEFQSYYGRSNIYMPAAKRGVETLVAQTVSATFPGDEFFAVEADKPEYGAMAIDVQALEQNRVETAKVRMHAEAHYRQLFMKGNAPARVHFREKSFKTAKRRGRAATEAELYGAMGAAGEADEMLYSGPCFTPIPAEDFYAWPETASTLEECEGVFEDFTQLKIRLMQEAEAGKYVRSEVMSASGANNTDKHSSDTARLAGQGISPPQGDSQQQDFVDCSHVYCEFDPDAESPEKSKAPRPFHFTVTSDGKVLRAVEAKYTCPGACHPYVLGRIGQVVGRLWGSGLVEDIYPLQLLLNDQVNQAMDIANWVLNPGIISNPNLMMAAVTSMEPGFQWLATDVNQAARFVNPPQEMIQSSSVLLTQTQSWLNDFFMTPPVLSGGSAPGRAFRTATGVGAAQKNAELPLQQIVRLQEVDVWQPMLKMFWSLDRTFAKDPVLLSAGGRGALAAREINPMQLYGDYRFRWSASTQLMNIQVRGQQIMQALQVLSAPPTLAALQQTGYRVNLGPLITRLMRDVFGFRDVDQILMEGAPAPQPGMGQPGMPPPPGGQVPLGNPLNGAQEGLDQGGPFGGVRAEANGIASNMGELGPMMDEGEYPS